MSDDEVTVTLAADVSGFTNALDNALRRKAWTVYTAPSWQQRRGRRGMR